MKITNIDQVEFINGVQCSSKVFAQNIVLKDDHNVIIGALMHQRKGLLEPITMFYQVHAPESHATMFDSWYISEDPGYIFGCFDFDNDQKYINYVNEFKIPIGHCNRTGTLCYPTEVDGYSAYCPELDEDLYDFEWTALTD